MSAPPKRLGIAADASLISGMSIGFKEWALVCEELGKGRQSIILRKGGIAEGREGFHFQHDAFLLLPTLFHEQVSKLKLPGETPLPVIEPGTHTVALRAVVEWTRDLSDWEEVQRLEEFHLWREHVIRERFEYDEKQGVSLAFVRIYRLQKAAKFSDAPKYGGCRSWVTLPDMEEMLTSEPVLSEENHRALESRLRGVLGV
jgi:hypothetical protein